MSFFANKWVLVLSGSALAGVAGCRMDPPPRPTVAVSAAPRISPEVDPEAARAVAALASNDFSERSRAADALMDMGDAALPALGEAGELVVSAHGRVPVSATNPVVAAILSTVGEERLVGVHLSSPAPTLRRAAAFEIGRRGLSSGAPALIDHLDDADPRVRSAAIASLRRLADRRGDGVAAVAVSSPMPGPRDAAGWRIWWGREGSPLATTSPAGR